MIEQFAKELWTRVCLETIDLEPDICYITRGVIQSVLHDMREAHKEPDAGTQLQSDIAR